MTKYSIEDSTLSAIADAIRAKTGASGMLTPAQMAVEVQNVDTVNNQDKTVTENGTYTADEGYTGLGTVTVNVESSGNDASDLLNAIITRNIRTIDQDDVTGVGYASFKKCYELVYARFKNATYAYGEAFYDDLRLKTVDLPACTTITTYVFYNARNLISLILRSETLCTLSNVNSFTSSSIANGTGYIYVPSSILADYQAATNWSTYSAQFRALEDYTVDGTITGELDESKI